jgi:hypothetical protein
MPQRRWITSSTLMMAGLVTAAALSACGSNADTTQTGSSSSLTGTSTGTGAPGTTKPNSLTITDAQGTQLCDAIRPELSNWRVQGPTLGRIGFNLIVHEWAARNGGINGQVLADKAVIDRVTTKSCADVRQQAIEALELTNLAGGLAL